MERLFNYLENHYVIGYVPIKVQETLKELNNGTSRKYIGITISYDDMYNMLRYYTKELFALYKRNKAYGKCKTKTERMLYDIRIMVDWLEKYNNRPELLYNEVTHSQILHPEIDGGETLQDNSKFIGEWHYANLRKEAKERIKEAEMVKEMLKEMEEMEKEESEIDKKSIDK